VTGYHEVKVFPYFPDTGKALVLPEGWKPFGTYLAFDNYERLTLHVVARKWNRAAPAEA
jgi:hypothetical protein